MRTLTSIQSSTNILLDLEFHLKASDVSTTWIFENQDIIQYPKIGWEIDYTGGMGKSSNYRITLASSIGFLSENRDKVIKGQSFLKVFTNSDNFTPHVGRVRAIERDADNSNVFELIVYDDFLDGNPLIPRESIVNSYSIVHPEVIKKDMGYPLYYGKHTRPFYMTAVDCNIDNLLGPRNVSSANHVTSVWYNPTMETTSNGTHIMFNKNWAQEAAGNLITGGYEFEVRDIGPQDTQLSKFGETAMPAELGINSATDSAAANIVNFDNYFKASANRALAALDFGGAGAHLANYEIQQKANLNIVGVSRIQYYFTFPTLPSQSNLHFYSYIESAGNLVNHIITSGSYDGLVDVTSTVHSDILNLSNARIGVYAWGNPAATYSTCVLSMYLYAIMRSEAYNNYSVFGVQVNCSDIAVSENPSGILADLIDQTSFDYVTIQNSASQADISSYNFQCFLGERQELLDIMQEFGETTGTYYWMGDSGYINSRTYQESSTVTSSIDYTLTTSDIIPGTLKIKDNPIGAIFYQTKKAKRLKLDYDYNFSSGLYEKTLVADKNNNAFCNSADASGIQKEISKKSKYIKETQTASYYLDNLVRRHALSDVIVEGDLPGRFMGMEITDVLRIKHPSLLNSDSLFQVTKVGPDYHNGEVQFTANEILNVY